MTGSLQIKNNTYYTVLSYKDTDGKHKKKWQTTGLPVKGNKRKAEEILRQRIAEFEAFKLQAPKSLTFAKWMKLVVEEKKDIVSPTTYDGYYDMVRLHIAPYFAEKGILLTDLTAGALEAYYLQKLKEGLSPNTISKHHSLIKTALKKAMKLEYIHRNVAELADPPRKVKKNIPDPYDAEEIKQVLSLFQNDKLFYVVFAAFTFGLRRSEILGLRWDRLDLENGLMLIEITAVRCKENGKTVTKIRDTTKTETSYRAFELTKKQIAVFQSLKAKQEEYRRFFKNDYSDKDAAFVFLNEKGVLFKPDYVTHHFKHVLRKYGMREIRFHDSRHSCATYLKEDFDMKDIQKYLGHANYQFTADTYVHVKAITTRKMTETMDCFLPDVS